MCFALAYSFKHTIFLNETNITSFKRNISTPLKCVICDIQLVCISSKAYFICEMKIQAFTYLGLLQLEHRPSTIPLQRTRFWAASHAPFQLSFWALSSASVSRLQLLQGRPLLRFPWGFQLRACLVMLAGGFLSVWPIQPHFLWRICLASGSCPARSHKSVLLILSGHRMSRIRRRPLMPSTFIPYLFISIATCLVLPASYMVLTFHVAILVGFLGVRRGVGPAASWWLSLHDVICLLDGDPSSPRRVFWFSIVDAFVTI